MPHPLKEGEGVVEVESEPDADTLLLGDAKPVSLLAPLLLCVPEGHADAVPGWPGAAAPPVVLG